MTVYEYNTRLDALRFPILRESEKYKVDGRKSYNNADLLYDLMAEDVGLRSCAEEYAYIVAFDNRLRVKGLCEIGHGSINGSNIDIRSAFEKLFALGAFSFALVHNHPSGLCAPSNEDFSVTKRIIDAGKLLDLPCVEHLIIGDGTYYSFRKETDLF